jgi:serine-type D-Ala-D-Ala carboxypeptidase (penicillin-binding protein 5/6)
MRPRHGVCARAVRQAVAAMAVVAATAGTAAAAAPAGHGQGAVRPRPAAHAIGGPLLASHGTVVRYPQRHALALPAVPASAYVIANADTGEVLAAKDPHGRFGPASTLKVLTAVTLIPRLNPDMEVLVSRRAADAEPFDAGLIAGRTYKASDLFTALLTMSANDAAVALTQATGSLRTGMALINAEARRLRADDTVAKQPNGLPAAGQVESAYDEALIARQALRDPDFMKYDSTRSARFQVKPHHWETLVNQNWLLTRYRGGIGGKIGWTQTSEATYVGLARRHGVTLIVTIMHCTPLQEITSAVKLLNWGFAMDGKVRPVGVLVGPLAARHLRQSGNAVSTTRQAAGVPAVRPASASLAGYAVAAGIVAAVSLGLAGVILRRRAYSGSTAAGRRSLRYSSGTTQPEGQDWSAGVPSGWLGLRDVLALLVLARTPAADHRAGQP